MDALIIMSRAPVSGKTKTRLMSHLSGDECSCLHKAFLEDIFKIASSIKDKKKDLDVFLNYTPNNGYIHFRGIRGIDAFVEGRNAFPQPEGNIGVRMDYAAKKVLDMGYDRIIVIGSDIPALKEEDIIKGYDKLINNDIVFGPTEDGGYYLVGMKQYCSKVFDIDGKLWGESSVLEATEKTLNFYGKSVGYTNTRYDIDEFEDMIKYLRDEERETETKKHIEKLVELYA